MASMAINPSTAAAYLLKFQRLMRDRYLFSWPEFDVGICYSSNPSGTPLITKSMAFLYRCRWTIFC